MSLVTAFGLIALIALSGGVAYRHRGGGSRGPIDVLDASPVFMGLAWLAVVLLYTRPSPLPPSLLAVLLIAGVWIGAVAVARIGTMGQPVCGLGVTRREWSLLYVAAVWGGCLFAVYLGSRSWPVGTGTVEGRSALVGAAAAVLVAALPAVAGLGHRPRWRAAPIVGAVSCGALSLAILAPEGAADVVLRLAGTSLLGFSLWYASASLGVPHPRVVEDHLALADDEALRAGVPYGVIAFLGICLFIVAFAGLRPT